MFCVSIVSIDIAENLTSCWALFQSDCTSAARVHYEFNFNLWVEFLSGRKVESWINAGRLSSSRNFFHRLICNHVEAHRPDPGQRTKSNQKAENITQQKKVHNKRLHTKSYKLNRFSLPVTISRIHNSPRFWDCTKCGMKKYSHWRCMNRYMESPTDSNRSVRSLSWLAAKLVQTFVYVPLHFLFRKSPVHAAAKDESEASR